ncbi:MAG: C25 family cysteine peptidase [Chitinophagales bacterium]|nr:C25 family cysteine peptidase [Chitinophagales bacterium]
MKLFIHHSIFLLVLLCLSFQVHAQKQYGNEWMQPDQVYLKLKVSEDGIYRITYEELVAAGFIQNNTDGSHFEMFNYGKECALYVSDKNFGQGAFIEFYGEKNRIGMDSLLYKDWKKDLFNPEYSLITDTNVYFLTLSPQNINKRYILTEPDYSQINLEAIPYYWHEEKVIYNNAHFKNIEFEIRYSHFEPSEGFGSAIVANSNHNLNVSNIYEDGPNPILNCRIGNNNQVARLEIRFNNDLLETKINSPKATLQLTYNLEKSLLKSGNNTLNIKNVGSTTDRHRVAYASLLYARQFEFQNKNTFQFSLSESNTQRLLKINAFKHDNQQVFVYDPIHQIRYSAAVINNQVQVLLSPVGSFTTYHMSSTSGVKSVIDMHTIKAQSFADQGTDYLIITNHALRNAGLDYVQDYADYRSSAIGGNYKVQIIDIQDIYDNFGYGIDRHFYGVKQMSKFLHENWNQLHHVFIIGKGLEYNIIRNADDVKTKLHKTFFIPTYGHLGSDNMLFSEDNYPDPYFSIGRLAAKTPENIKNYLDKIREYESTPSISHTIDNKYWIKRVLQLGGGQNPNEQELIQKGLIRMADIIQDTIYGGEVHSYYKQSTDAILYETSEEINAFFNEGVSLVNFFGHSSAGSWEFPIDNPRNFRNYGKYPFLNALGCYAGNLHADIAGLSESFVLEPGRGSIGFLASTGTAGIPSLSIYGQNFLQNLLNTSRTQTYGSIIQKLAHQKRNSTGSDLALYAQITYHGDPAIKFHVFDAADYLFDPASVQTNPSIVQGSSKEFKVEVDILNLGTYTGDTIDVVCYHQLPDGSIVDTILLKIDQIANRKTIQIPLNNYDTRSLGKNTIFAIIDPKNQQQELPLPVAKSNNTLNDGRGFDFYVIGNFASIVYPPDFAMINTKEHFVLKASTNTVPVTMTNYVFQIDTTAYFNSPILETGVTQSTGGVITYQPNLDLVANRVYYWRVSPDSTGSDGYRWVQSSFAFLPDEAEGWNQSHYFQFTANTFDEMEISEATDRQFEFGKEYHTAQLRNRLWDNEDKPGFTYDNVRFGSVTPWNYMDSGLGFVLCDRNEFLPGFFNPAGGLYGSTNPTGGQVRGFFFKTDTQKDRENIVEFIETQLKPNYYLHVFSILKNENSAYRFEGWEQDSIATGKNIFNVLEGLGAKQIRTLLRDTVPYIFQVEKGRQVLAEIVGISKTDIIQSKVAVSTNLPEGSFTSVPIGKVAKWGDLKLNMPLDQDQQSGLTTFSIKDGTTSVIDSIPLNGFYSQAIEAEDFLELKLSNKNEKTKVSPQLAFWRIGYEPLPDAAIQFIKNVPDLSKQLIAQGEKIQVHYRVVNVNYADMDSIYVKYTYTDNQNRSLTKYKVLEPLKAGKTIEDVVEFTVGSGRVTGIKLTIEINPDGRQPELYFFNNTLTQQFGVQSDNDNPLLQLTFDGIQIMDGDIVSSAPEICISLYDENDFLPITDPESFEIKLDTGYNEIVTIDVHGSDIRFEPATAQSKTAKLYYRPQFRDGEYTLTVQGRDASGNKSGIHPRKVTFKVITAKSVSNILNYPNPFSNSTQFIFTLTGDEVPDNISISIYTVTGKVVREITREELGPLHIGVNRTSYWWDGTDAFGEKLANGVYLYKVNVVHKDGSKYDSFSNRSIDKYFKDSFGKLVIIR